MQRGRFLTLEGGEGTGKSTQAARLVERLQARGLSVVRTREPGGTPDAEALRDLLVKGHARRWSPTAELLLMYAARADHLDRVIRPALDRGQWVVCDRFADSSRAYQGFAGGVDADFIEQVDQAVVGLDQPDLTLVFDLPVETGLERAKGRGGDARFESKGADFHERLRDGFLAIAALHPDRCVVIDAAGALETVTDHVWREVETRLLSEGARG